ALGGDRQRDRHNACEGESTALDDAIISNAEHDRPVLVEATSLDLADDSGVIGLEQHDIAVAGLNDAFDPLRLGESGVLGKMGCLAMSWHRNFGACPTVEPRHFRSSRVA